MTYRGESIPRAVDGIEASRRVAWARYYEESEHAARLATVNAMLRERVEELVPLLLDLVDAVLHDRNVDAFAFAYRVREAVNDFESRQPGRA